LFGVQTDYTLAARPQFRRRGCLLARGRRTGEAAGPAGLHLEWEVGCGRPGRYERFFRPGVVEPKAKAPSGWHSWRGTFREPNHTKENSYEQVHQDR
jgi:hypothetical protein